MVWYKDAEQFKALSGHEVEGEWYPRVTRILSIKAKPALENFLKEVGMEAAEAIKIKSAEEGTVMHEVIQKIAVGEKITVPEAARPAAEAFEAFNKERGIFFHPEFVERPIWSAVHRYAGTVDALAEIDGKFGVLDIKTSTGFYPEYNLQTAAYVQALQEPEIKRAIALPRNIETRWILRVDQNKICARCGATLREKGGRSKIRTPRQNGGNGNGFGLFASPASTAGATVAFGDRLGAIKRSSPPPCPEGEHEWGSTRGEIELK
ncbi:MAG: hypothetical protein AAB904_02190, partial [Patescibacteria group bacterium]